MHESLLTSFVSPKTGAPLRPAVARRDGEDVLEGTLADPQGATFPIRGGVPRFVAHETLPSDQKETVDSFSFKWSKIPGYAFESKTKANREKWYFERFGFAGEGGLRDFLNGARRLLEAGTGTGVDTDLFARNSEGTVFGIDISTAIDEAARRFRGNPRIALAQADIGALPFAEGFFDFVSCDQVLHHTPDPVANFAKLAKLVRPGGHLLVYVYKVKGPLREFADDHLRAKLTRAPVAEVVDFSERIARLGRNLSGLHATVEVEDDLPELGIKKGRYDVQRLLYDHVVKCFWNDDYDFDTNAMINFDWYRPTHAFRYTEADVRGWAKTSGLEVKRLDVSPSGISVVTRKPG